MWLSTGGALTLVSFLCLGCGGASTVAPPGRDPCGAAQAIRPSAAFLTVAEEGDIAARVLPGGFGGIFLDIGSSGSIQLVAYFRDVSLAAEARRDLRDLLACGGAYPGWASQLLQGSIENIAVRQGLYTGSELLSYLRALGQLTTDPDVWAVELDPETNRVWIGLLGGSGIVRIQQAVTAKAVPLGATVIEAPPTVTNTEPFEVLNSPVSTTGESDPFGTLFFSLRVRYSNRQASPRYPDWCVDPDLDLFTAYFLHIIEKWDGAQWKEVRRPLCNLVLLAPRSVNPGETATDSVPVAASRRLNTRPYWQTARITGTYRFVGKVYMSMTTTPPFVAELAPPEEQVSAPFRLINTLPF
jgi:hypothetical protein